MIPEQLEIFLKVFNVELPSFVLDKIVLIFADGNSNNWDVDNVDYYFKDGAIECPFYKDFFYVPGFSRYVINKEGDLCVVKTGRMKKWSITAARKHKNVTGGYFVSHAVCDINKKRKGTSRHRLLCLTFKHPGCFVGNLTVNHKNGVPGFDDLDNLEFCTYAENTQHAYDSGLYKNKVVPVTLLNWKTGKEYHLSSIKSAASITGMSGDLFYLRISNSNSIRYPDGWRIKRQNDVWKKLDDRYRITGREVEVICRNIFDNKTIIFPTISDAARELDISMGTILSQIDDELDIPVYGWNFRKLSTFEGWPVYTEKHLNIFKDRPRRPGDGIEVYDCDKNEMLFFTSPKKAGEYFNLSPITISKLARYELTREKRYKFKLFRIRENLYGPANQ